MDNNVEFPGWNVGVYSSISWRKKKAVWNKFCCLSIYVTVTISPSWTSSTSRALIRKPDKTHVHEDRCFGSALCDLVSKTEITSLSHAQRGAQLWEWGAILDSNILCKQIASNTSENKTWYTSVLLTISDHQNKLTMIEAQFFAMSEWASLIQRYINCTQRFKVHRSDHFQYYATSELLIGLVVLRKLEEIIFFCFCFVII